MKINQTTTDGNFTYTCFVEYQIVKCRISNPEWDKDYVIPMEHLIGLLISDYEGEYGLCCCSDYEVDK